MTGLRVDVETKQLGAFLDAAPKKVSLAVLRAVKRGTKSAATHANRVAAKDMGLKVGDVRKRIRVKPPNGQTLTGEIRASLARVPIIQFSAKGPRPSRGRGRGISYRSGSGRKTNPNAFFATLGSREGVFERKGRSRIPTRELFGPSVGRVVDLHRKEIMARGEEVTTAELNRLVDRIFGASGG